MHIPGIRRLYNTVPEPGIPTVVVLKKLFGPDPTPHAYVYRSRPTLTGIGWPKQDVAGQPPTFEEHYPVDDHGQHEDETPEADDTNQDGDPRCQIRILPTNPHAIYQE